MKLKALIVDDEYPARQGADSCLKSIRKRSNSGGAETPKKPGVDCRLDYSICF